LILNVSDLLFLKAINFLGYLLLFLGLLLQYFQRTFVLSFNLNLHLLLKAAAKLIPFF